MTKKSMRRGRRVAPVAFLMTLAPFLMGGCPEFRDSLVTSLETATGAALDAALTALFDNIRSDSN